MHRVGVFGWGIVAPQTKNIDAFAENLEKPQSWLEPYEGFGPSNFLVGKPNFDFNDYKSWIDKRFPPSRFFQLTDKMDQTSLFAIGAFIQSLQQNSGLEQVLQQLGTKAHVYVSTGIGSVSEVHKVSLEIDKAQRRWNCFWGSEENNTPLQHYLNKGETKNIEEEIPINPVDTTPSDREEAEETWRAFWTKHNPDLKIFLKELAEIDEMTVQGTVEAGKLKLIKDKQKRKAQLLEKWKAPVPPWDCISANVLWNIHNTPAAQITMLGKIHGLSMAPVAACATFNICLKLAIDAIKSGEAKAVVIGATESDPMPHSVGAFASARVAASGKDVSKPLTGLRGTHVSGGAAVWVVGDYDYMVKKGFKPLGLEPLSVGTSSDAGHIITPSEEGPKLAIEQAIDLAGISPEEIVTWDLHATATPGDYMEVSNLQNILTESALFSARKGTFGHGLGACGGWELTAQYMGYEKNKIFPTPLAKSELNEQIKKIHTNFVFDSAVPAPKNGYAGKLSMGVGGINACVISKPYDKQ